MKKSFLILATAALFAACSNEKAITIEQPVAQQQASDDAIRFGVYVNRGLTRAGQPDTLTTKKLAAAGFGVFAFYTNNEAYSQYAIPNFMYNQEVTGTGDPLVWSYSPLKYWPNEYGTGANSDDMDKLSFFAYAPYVEVKPTSGIPVLVTKADSTNRDSVLNKNITALTRNTAVGDPMVKYVVDTDPSTSVDLLWGVQPESVKYDSIVEFGWTQAAGFPYTDLIKDKASKSKINLQFNHALAQFNATIDAIVDKDTVDLDANTKIFVRSITFTGIAMKGALNLNNGTKNVPYWLDYEGKNEIISEEVTFYDGRKDGKEATANGEQRSELPCMLNPEIVQDTTSAKSGVVKDTLNLFKSLSYKAPIYVIPTTDAMNVTIVYDVETKDDNLATYLSDGVTHGSSVENRIYKENVFAKFEAGKSYTLNIHLGMTSVKFDAEVTNWVEETAADVDLPQNK